jgi:hypothetical protein
MINGGETLLIKVKEIAEHKDVFSLTINSQLNQSKVLNP